MTDKILTDRSLLQQVLDALVIGKQYAKHLMLNQDRFDKSITIVQEALAAPQPAEPAARAISYDGQTPYRLWHEGDGPLLDLEIRRIGGTAKKLAIYTDAPPAQPAAPRQAPPPAPRAAAPTTYKPPAGGAGGFADMDDDIPFVTSSAWYDMTTSKARRLARCDF